jgi:hypothetical protein
MPIRHQLIPRLRIGEQRKQSFRLLRCCDAGQCGLYFGIGLAQPIDRAANETRNLYLLLARFG